jgi:hypothetical protein
VEILQNFVAFSEYMNFKIKKSTKYLTSSAHCLVLLEYKRLIESILHTITGIALCSKRPSWRFY